MKILYIFGFLIIFCHGQFEADDVVTRGCKIVNKTPLLRLKEFLFCDYDDSVRPSHHKIVTNVTLKLIPQMMEFTEEGVLTLHSWMSFTWMDTYLTWTPSDHDGIVYIHVKSYDVWIPDLFIYNSGDMSNHEYRMIFKTDCLLFNTGSVICVTPMKYVSKCDPDYTYWPYDQHKCRITLGSWSHTGEEIDVHLNGTGVDMNSYENNTVWNLKLLKAEKIVKKYKCCPNDTFPRIDYTFLLTRHNDIHHRSYITPAIALILLTLTVLWLDSRSVERVAIASVNFICHLLCMFDLHWIIPYNGVNPPNMIVFYRESLMLATFALILTALLRKLQNMSTEMPGWISSMTMFILSNRAGRFLVLNDEESEIGGENIATEDNSDHQHKIKMKESSWRHFAAIIEWLSFFCVILTYIIIIIILIPPKATN